VVAGLLVGAVVGAGFAVVVLGEGAVVRAGAGAVVRGAAVVVVPVVAAVPVVPAAAGDVVVARAFRGAAFFGEVYTCVDVGAVLGAVDIACVVAADAVGPAARAAC
jgi:hypothetical protein